MDLSHLKKLSTVRSGKNIKFLSPAVYSGGWCPMRVATNIAEDLAGLSSLMVCMPECATHSRSMTSRPEGPNGEKRWLYTLDANEVIFGCRQGVMEALRTMDREGAKYILMIATCVTDLIGEDFEAIINELQPQINAKLTYVALGQFKNFGTAYGSYKTANALARLMEPAKEIRSDTVNVLYLDAWRTRGVPMKLPLIVQELEAKGITVRRLTSEATLQNFLDGPDAAANIVVSSYMEPLAREMEKQFGTPCFDLTKLFHVSQIEEAYAELGGLLGIDLSDSFPDWHKKATELENRAERELAGKRFVMIPEVDMPIALTEYLTDFGMEPILIHLDDPMPLDIQTANRLKKRQIDPPVCRIMNDDHDLPMIRDELKPDLTFGYLRNPVPGLATCEEMWDFAGIVGYERTTGILSRIFEVLETGKTKEVFDLYGPAPL